MCGNAMMIRRGRLAFTLIELLVTLGVIGILLALLLPAVQSAREAARRSRCQSALKQLCLALHNYQDAHQVLPPGSIARGPSFPILTGWGWGAQVLPYVDQAALYQQIDFHQATVLPPNRELLQSSLPIWRCPSDTAPGVSLVELPVGAPVRIAAGNYVGVEPGLTAISSMKLDHMHDGLSTTLLVGESRNTLPSSSGNFGTNSWTGIMSDRNQYDYSSVPHLAVHLLTAINRGVHLLGTFSSRHAGGAYFALGDGHVEFLGEQIDLNIYQALGTPNGGEVVSF